MKNTDPLAKHPLSAKYQNLFTKFAVNTPLRLAHFFGQAAHESNLKPRVENLNYSVEALLSKFGRHRISEVDARKLGRIRTQLANQEMLANILYGGSWGLKNLGNKTFGDGWKYRGRGIFQITGLSNYWGLTKYVQEVLGLNVDYVENPDLLLNEADSLIAALWYWQMKKLNSYADKDQGLKISRGINIGNPDTEKIPNHAEDRKVKTEKFKKVFS
ncbi:glycoside hydrolase family 19 protein [Chryseobacterium indoltheticum]|uniref:Chitinase n=1 Tax=Chryseobacterium indoltheticum TaxID=254 RepID=A0A381F3U5_9FLAO|nr:hypothetical protein [Chryseobacterium indoltheticum]AZA74798.1 glycoside hydrolase family 19 protein [Chryseobacterium indoltheticum]SIQ34917.1 putative chitinase [Chryseobacterium indoltheticum]SUX41235.1 Predicted chitinase [Chryseobacterium indoltheticum]